MPKPEIYSLHCPETGRLRYLGMSTNPKQRLSQHMARCNADNCHRNNWLRSLKVKGLKPIMLIVETVTEDTWEAAEKHFIKRARELGFDLVNTTEGGEGLGAGESHPSFGKKHSSETIAAMRRAREGKSSWNAGKKTPAETCAKISKAQKGREFTPEHCAAISDSMKGRPAWNKGKPHSEETKAKIRAAWVLRKERENNAL